jgi:hypothetical protein
MIRFLILLSCLVAACAHGPQVSFAFDESGQSLGSHTADPAPLVRASGHIVELVTVASEGGKDIVAWSSHDGDAYRRGERVNEIAGEVTSRAEAQPQLLSGPGMRLCALWLARSEKGGVRLRCSRDFGEHWQPTVTVPTGTPRPPSFFSGSISPAGTVVVTWFGFDEVGLPGTAQLWLATSADGTSFTSPRRIANDLCPCCRPALAASGDALFVAYRHVDPNSCRDIVVSRSVDDGRTWSDPVFVSNDNWRIHGCPHSGPALAVDRDRLAVAWLTQEDDRAQLFWAESRDGARHFSARKPLSRDALDPNHPSLTLQNGKLFAAFEARDPAEGNGWGTRRLWLEDVESQSLHSVPDSKGGTYPSLASLSTGAVLVAWTQRDGEDARARMARVRVQHRN